MKLWRKILLGGAAVLLVGQFIRPAKNLSTSPAGKDDFATLYPPPPEVARILETACYDCHSNHTRYPWYAELQPAGWWLASHINDGKRALNFNEFGAYTAKRQAKKLDAILDQVTDGTMPLTSYTWIHRDAILTPAQSKAFTDWIASIRDSLADK